ncbi:hypothetical protein K438DRAFT_1852563, partial [Mycena galopus ATCC 62051]
MVRWKGYGLEHNKWVKHSDVLAKDAIDAYYRRYPNAPHRIASAAFDSLSFRKRDAHVRFMRRDATFQGGGDVRGTARPSVRPSVRPPSSGPSHCPAATSDPLSNAYSVSDLARPFRLTRTSALARNVVLRPSGLHSPSSPFVRPLALERTMQSSSGLLPITSDTCYWL